MIYTFKKGVANDFSAFSENLVPPHAYFVPFSSKAVFREGNGLTRRHFSDRQKSLSGEWDFCYLPDGHYERTFDSARCVDSMPVPGVIEDYGYFLPVGSSGPDFSRLRNKIPDGKKSFNSVYVYKKSFLVNDLSKKHTVLFTAVRGRFEVYVNGVYVGFSALGQGEFLLSPYLVSGENELLVVIKRWSPCAFFNRDYGDSVGIVGDVILCLKNANSLFDYDLYCKEDEGVFNGKFTFYFDSDNSGARAEIGLSHEGKEIFTVRGDVSSLPLECEFSGAYLPYTAETPNLYDLYIRVIENGRVTEYVREKVGFTSLDEMGGVISFCSRPLKLRAVEYNATRSRLGETMTLSDYEKDFSLIKEYGFNAIKTLFPLDPAVLEAARNAGLYLLLNSGIDTDGERAFGEKHRNAVTDDKRFEKPFLDKIAYLYAMTRNNPAVLFYDFGRESAESDAIEKCLRYVVGKGQKLAMAADYESCRTLFDPTVDELLDEINFVGAQKAVFLSSYACAGGLGSGYLNDFDEIVDSTPCCFGGCIREFVDETIDDVCIRDEGLFTTRRTPYPAAKLHRYLARPVKVRVVGEDRIEITNVSYFTDTSDKTILLTVVKDGKTDKKAKLDLVLPPRMAREMAFSMGKKEGDKHLNATVVNKKGNVISTEQSIICANVKSFDMSAGRKVKVFEKGDIIEIAFDCGKVGFSQKTGNIAYYTLLGADVLRPALDKKTGCFVTKIDRPFVRNVLSGDYDRTEVVLERFTYEAHENVVEIRSKNQLYIDGKPRFDVVDDYKVYAGGAIVLRSVLRPLKNCPDNIDCFAKGLRFTMPFDRVTYYGRGEDDNYVDCNAHTTYGVYETTAQKMSSATPFGQERGNRTDVHYAVVRNADGLGMLISAERAPYQLRVSNCSDEELAQGYLTRTDPQASGVYVDVAAAVSGYGSGVSEPMPKYRIKSVEHTLEFRLIPLKTVKR